MWILKKDNNIIASFDSNKTDIFVFESSIFRGPNRIVWYCYTPSENMMAFSGDERTYTLLISNGKGGFADKIMIRYESGCYNHDMGCMEFRFVPNLWYLAQVPIAYTSDPNSTITSNIKALLGDKIILRVTEAYDKAHQMAFEGMPCDYLAKMAKDLRTEFFIGDTAVIFGGVQQKEAEKYPILVQTENTIAKNISGGKIFISAATHLPVPGPGSILTINDTPRRVVYRKMYSKGDETTFSVITTELNTPITEIELAKLLPYDEKLLLMQKVYTTYESGSNFIGVANPKKDNKITAFSNESYDMQETDKIKGLYTTAIQASPYAGKNVGLSFPTHTVDEHIAVVFPHKGDRSCSAEIAQIPLKKNVPLKDDEKDFRLTLPDGGTLYYDTSAKTWIMSAKTKIIIGSDSTESVSTKVPSPGKARIEIDEGETSIYGSSTSANHIKINDNGKIVIKIGSSDIDVTTNKVTITSASIDLGGNATQSVGINGDSINATTDFLLWCNTHVHPAPGTPPATSFTGPDIGTIVSVGKVVKAK